MVLAASIAVLLAITLAGWHRSGEFASGGADRAQPDAAADGDAPVGPGSVIFDSAVLPIAPPEARALNDARPVDIARPHAARPFALPAGDAGTPAYAAALHCLAQAVFYEAGNQGDGGGRAVAQVVLNRVRHPAFPHTVCGVVFQGFARPTGCQFTFTCDGSLAREPSARGWHRALRIAREALGGSVDPEVGLATHYHADYVVPYWASSLAKVGRVGAHLFYQLPGRLGTIAAFTARYDWNNELAPAPGGSTHSIVSAEHEPGSAAAAAETPLSAVPRLRSDAEAGALIQRGGELRQGARQLSADVAAGSLRVGDGALPLADGESASRR